MNIFWLALSVAECAEYYCDTHVRKIILEIAQMLSTAHRVLSPDMIDRFKVAPYKITHRNHPCAVWVRGSRGNYTKAVDMGLALCAVYTRQSHKRHKTQDLLEELKQYLPSFENEDVFGTAETQPPKCVPEWILRMNLDVVDSYRLYYMMDKVGVIRGSTYNGRTPPEWLDAQEYQVHKARAIEFKRAHIAREVSRKKRRSVYKEQKARMSKVNIEPKKIVIRV